MANVEFTTEELASEEWRPVVGWEGRYEVSNLGRVKSLRCKGKPNGKPLILAPSVGRGGYLHMTLGITRQNREVHTVVAEAFLGPRPLVVSGYRIEVNHIDTSKANNRSSNLEYLTQLENAQHATRMGLQRPPTGARHGSRTHPERVPSGSRCRSAKLNEVGVREILERLSAGAMQRDLARQFGVSKMAISLIKSAKTWKHVTRHESP